MLRDTYIGVSAEFALAAAVSGKIQCVMGTNHRGCCLTNVPDSGCAVSSGA